MQDKQTKFLDTLTEQQRKQVIEEVTQLLAKQKQPTASKEQQEKAKYLDSIIGKM